MPDESGHLLSVIQVAECLGVNRHRVWRLIRDGRIPATKIGHGYVVRSEDVAAYRPLPPGRPRKVTDGQC